MKTIKNLIKALLVMVALIVIFLWAILCLVIVLGGGNGHPWLTALVVVPILIVLFISIYQRIIETEK